MKKSLIALSVLAATSAFAGGTGGIQGGIDFGTPVSLADNGVGDLLLAPVFLASGGWQSEIKLINTSTTLSTVAKVVFYENFRSTEVLDFFVYLSPGDYWNGVIATQPSGQITVTSSDDSVLTIGGTTWASAAAPAVYNFAANAGLGYIGVFEEAAWSLGAAPLNKNVVKARHDADNASGIQYTPANTANILTGVLRVANTLNGSTSTLPLTAWVNYDNRFPLTLGGLTVFGGDGASPAYTTTRELEDTFWNNNFVAPYNFTQGTTLGSITFPTRRTYDNILHGVGSIGRYPFNNVSKAPVQASVTVRDTMENTIAAQAVVTSPLTAVVRPAFAELGFYSLAAGAQTASDLDSNGVLSTLRTGSFTEGWASINIDSSTPYLGVAGGFLGAPAIGTQFLYSVNNGQIRSEWWYSQSATASNPQ